MSGSSWSLVIPVLVAGLALGALWVFWWRRKERPESEAQRRDRELLIADLRARQKVLYDQLRTASGNEREELELAAARNLRALEEAGGGEVSQPASESADAPAAVEREAPPRTSSAMVGFVGGAVGAALIGLLVVWAQRDARPREQMAPAPAPASGEEHPGGPQLSEREQDALEQIARQVEADPTDIMARKQYAVALLSTGQFFPAFEQAEILLASNADDPDGLYVMGMVRLRMGQEPVARELLDRLVAAYPEHVPALTALGVMALRSEGLEAAEEYWDLAVEASGGDNPEVEQLRSAARQQIASQQGAGAVAPPTTDEAPPAAAAPVSPQADPSAYTLRVELAAGRQVPATSVLFVSLRQGDAGPPSAVKRIAAPAFPLTITLSSSDSMMGQPLPPSGTVTLRLDSDGNASTRDDTEPEGRTDMAMGDIATLTLQ